jgi:hypothetical protein
VAFDMSRSVGSTPPTQCASWTACPSGSVKVRTRITPKSATVRSVRRRAIRSVRSRFERFCVSSAKREMVDPPALEHRPSRRRRDPSELERVQGRAGANRDQRVSTGTFRLGYGQLHHFLSSENLLVEKRKPVEVACEDGDVIHA